MSRVVFLLIWDDEPHVHWSKWHSSCKSLAQVRWRGTDMTVDLAVDCMETTMNPPKKVSPSKYYPLLKSNLQKQIRRGSTSDAVRTAMQMWSDDPFSLLWRLPIIAVEDSELFKELSVVIWLMSAYSKGLVPTTQHLNYVLRLVANICSHRSCLYYTAVRSGYQGRLVCYSDLKGYGTKDILRSFLYRIAYGGMANDLTMLLKAISYYFEMGAAIPEIDEKVVVTPSPKLAILQASADFHVNPLIIPLLAELAEKKGLTCTEDEVKQAIWERSSRRNVRIAYPASEKRIMKVYNIIKENFDMMATNYIREVMTPT